LSVYGHIPKTKQDTVIVTMERYGKLASLILLPQSDPPPPPTSSWRDILVSDSKCMPILTASYVTWASDNRCCKPSRPSSHHWCCQLL